LQNASISKAFDVTEAMARTKKRWRNRIEAIRPHDLFQQEVDGLQINCDSLFQWAIDSAKQYFEAQDNLASEEEAGLAAIAKAKSMKYFDPLSPVPTLELVSSPEVVFNVTSNRTTRRLVTFQNTGTVAIEYNWKPECHVDSIERAYRDGVYFGSKVSQIIDEKAADKTLPRTSAYVHTKSTCFFCSQPKGIVLPGETLSILFGFNSTNIPGSVTQTWKMHTVPRTKFSHRVAVTGITASLGAASPSTSMDQLPSPTPKSKPVDVMLLQMQGIVTALEMDETTDKRREMVSFMDQQALNCMVEDEYTWCLRRVRLPVRVNDLNCRYIAAFQRINSDLIRNLSEKFGSSAQLFITPSRLRLVDYLCAVVVIFYDSVHSRLLFWLFRGLLPLMGSNKVEDSTDNVFAGVDADVEINAILQRHCQTDAIAALRDEVFPEKSIVRSLYVY
jgi:hypothetical protein